jgi:predicted  nucleic acid-binding Zn-ribbon protein
MMNLVSELSAWETELANLRSEVKILREAKITTDFELDQLRRRNAMLEEKVEYHLTRHIRLKTQLDRTGADLVQAIHAFAADDTRDTITQSHEPIAQLNNTPTTTD